MKNFHYERFIGPAVVAFALTLAPGAGWAQSTGNGSMQASSQDKQYLEEIAQDSNFEKQTSQMAMQKSSSQDVKEYAHMVNRDHTSLKQQIRSVDHKVNVEMPPADSMKTADRSKLDELKALSGKDFDDAYIKGLVKGNAQSVQDAKDEVGSTSIPVVKTLAERNLRMDQKHTEKANQLAKVHHVEVQQ